MNFLLYFKKKLLKNRIGKFLTQVKHRYRNKYQINKKIQGVNNTIHYHPNCYFTNVKFNVTGNNNSIIIKNNCYLNNLIFYIHGNNNIIHLSEHVSFNSKGEIHIKDNYCKIEINSHTSFEESYLEATESNSIITIGYDCMFSKGIEIRTGDSHSILDIHDKNKINPSKNIEIGNHVWVGAHCIILKGVKIADNSVVGIRSLVTKKFSEKNIVLAGTPAKKVKDNITWSRIRNYN